MREIKDIKELQSILLELIMEVHSICCENGIKYFLAFGSLIGAVRHKGFIPWDDDVDIMMPREDYNKFKLLWKQDPPKGFILQDEDVEDKYENNFMKIRKDHTTFLQFEGERKNSRHKGIFVDVFPGDRQAPNRLLQLIQKSEFVLSLLYNRGYTSTDKGVRAFFEKFLLRLVPRRFYRSFSTWLGKRGRRWNSKKDSSVIFPVTIRSCNRLYPADLFENMQEIEFRGRLYNAVRDTEKYLSIAYGDFMKLPPESERVWKHHPIILDFSRNYDELSEKERNATEV